MIIKTTFLKEGPMPGRISPKNPPPFADIVVELIPHTANANAYKIHFSNPFEAFSPSILGEQLNFTNGVNANGSSKPSRAFTMLTRLLRESGNNTETMTPGTIAINRVTMERNAIGIWSDRNPSITYWPVYVVVIAPLCPAANNAIAHSKHPPFKLWK